MPDGIAKTLSVASDTYEVSAATDEFGFIRTREAGTNPAGLSSSSNKQEKHFVLALLFFLSFGRLKPNRSLCAQLTKNRSFICVTRDTATHALRTHLSPSPPSAECFMSKREERRMSGTLEDLPLPDTSAEHAHDVRGGKRKQLQQSIKERQAEIEKLQSEAGDGG